MRDDAIFRFERSVQLSTLILGVLSVHGKGQGGKWRTLAWAPKTYGEVAAYEELRESMIEAARAINSNVTVPEQWIIYRKGKRLVAYIKTAIDNIVQRVAKRADIAA